MFSGGSLSGGCRFAPAPSRDEGASAVRVSDALRVAASRSHEEQSVPEGGSGIRMSTRASPLARHPASVRASSVGAWGTESCDSGASGASRNSVWTAAARRSPIREHGDTWRLSPRALAKRRTGGCCTATGPRTGKARPARPFTGQRVKSKRRLPRGRRRSFGSKPMTPSGAAGITSRRRTLP